MDKQILKECIHRLEEVHSVITTFGDKDSKEFLDKLDEIQEHLEEIL